MESTYLPLMPDPTLLLHYYFVGNAAAITLLAVSQCTMPLLVYLFKYVLVYMKQQHVHIRKKQRQRGKIKPRRGR
jgi:hypothetical protein